MFKRFFYILFITTLLIGCDKPDPHPELKDPIYNDLISSLSSTQKALEDEKKTLEGHIKESADVVPQTGQIKYAQKRINESKSRITRLEQEVQYLELKVEARKSASRSKYLQAFKKKEAWPDSKEWENYKIEKKLQSAKKTWDVRERIKESGFGQEKTPAPSAGGH